MKFSTRSGFQSFSGKVTLKNASLATVSNGPGVSIDANVRARMNGGVSSRIGGTVDGIVTILCELMKSTIDFRLPRNVSSNLLGSGCSFSVSAKTSDGDLFLSIKAAVSRNFC